MRIIGLLCLALIACDDGGGAGDADMGQGGAGGAGGVGGAGGAGGAMSALGVVVSEGDALIAVDDGASVGFEWGFQGGTMIRPAVLLPITLAGEVDEVRVAFRHRPDPDDPGAYGDMGDFPAVVLDLPLDPYDAEHVIAGPVDHQLGWSDLDGARFILVTDVSSPAFNDARSIRLSIAGEAGPCDVFPQHGDGCSYRDVPGQYVVLRHDPAPDCPGAVLPMTEFRPEGPAGLACFDDIGLRESAIRLLPWPGLHAGADPECLADLGLGPDGAVDGVIEVQERGGCSPVLRQPEIDASACAMCP